jgi:hypothetical protein
MRGLAALEADTYSSSNDGWKDCRDLTRGLFANGQLTGFGRDELNGIFAIRLFDGLHKDVVL